MWYRCTCVRVRVCGTCDRSIVVHSTFVTLLPSYVAPMYSNTTCKLPYVSACRRMLLVCTCMYSYVTRMYSYVLVCYSYVLLCYSYVTRVTRTYSRCYITWSAFIHKLIKTHCFVHNLFLVLLINDLGGFVISTECVVILYKSSGLLPYLYPHL